MEPWFFANLCRTLGCEQFIPHEYDSSKREEIRSYFTEKFKTKTRDEWFEIMTKLDILRRQDEHLDEGAERSAGAGAQDESSSSDTPDGGKVKQVGISVKLSDTPGSIRSLAPKLGQHTDEILGELGYEQAQIDRWREEGFDQVATPSIAKR